MQAAEWISFIALQLNRRQRQAGMALLRGSGPHDATVALLESVAQPRLACPACHSPQLHRHGHAHGLQRYRCVPCGRNALTGTPLARLRHKSLWIEYAACLLDSASVRQAAQQLGVHRNTTFRWRHRMTDRPHGQWHYGLPALPIKAGDNIFVWEKRVRPAAGAAMRADVAFPMSRSAFWWRATAPGRPSILSWAKGR